MCCQEAILRAGQGEKMGEWEHRESQHRQKQSCVSGKDASLLPEQPALDLGHHKVQAQQITS